MRRRIILAAAINATLLWGQRAGDWMTSGFDAQRSHWVRTDNKINVASLSNPGFELVWQSELHNAARGLETSTPPALVDFYIGYRGFRALAFIGASQNRVIAFDADLGRLEWQKQWDDPAAESTIPCPGGMTSAVTRPTVLAYPPVPAGGGAGRANPAKSGVGLPREGAVTLKRVPPPPPAPAPKPAAETKPAPAAPSPFAPHVQYLLALTGDGRLHSLWISNGNEPQPAMPFLPAGARAAGLVAADGMAYVATSNACGGVPDGVWGLDMTSGAVAKWLSNGLVAGAGPAVAPDGALYVAGGNGELTALAARTLEKKAVYRAGAPFASGPVVFAFGGQDYAAVATKQGRLHVVDTATMSGLQSEVFPAPPGEAVGLASWQDVDGRRWIIAPSSRSIMAFELARQGEQLVLRKGWETGEMLAPAAPVVVNGVVFGLSTGEARAETIAERVKQSRPAVLYAFDGATGKQLWNSGSQIKGFVHSGVLAAGGSRVYVATYDGTQYVFGFPIEH